MIKVYFDGVLIDDDSYTYLDNEYKLFTDSFKLGSVACNSFKLSVNKAMVENHPNEVKIEDDNTTFYLVVDSFTEDRYVYNYTLVDKLVNLNFNYDASGIINEKAELEEDCYTSDILADICNQAGIELDDSINWLNDIVVSWYDNTIQAREYVSYIAELQGGYACINEDGKLTIKPHKKASSKTIDIDECSDFILGEYKKITRVVYDNGIQFFQFQDEETEGVTLYLNPNNVYIINEEVVENIFNAINGFEFYLVDVPQAPMDSNIRAGDIITFTDGVNDYPTIAQYSMSYGGSWVGGYSLQLNTEKQEETKITGVEAKILKISTEINRANAELTIVAEKTEGNSQSISTLEQTVDGFIETVQKVDDLEDRTTTIETNIDGMKQTMTYSGGYNLLPNCVKQFGQAGWTGTFDNFTNTEIKQNSLTGSALRFKNDIEERTIQVPNGIYNFSAKYKKLVALAECKITINGQEIVFDSTDWDEKELTFEVTSNTIDIVFFSDTNDSLWLVDLLFIPGDIKQTWTPNPNEVDTGVIQLGGDKLKIESDTSNTKFEAGTDGTRVLNKSTNEVIAEYTDKGTKTKEFEAEKSQVAKLLTVDMGNQTWISRL